MTTSTALRVATRFIGSATPTVVVAHVDPLGTPWGWSFPQLSRMHLMPLTPQGSGLVWLEDGHGNRAFDPVDVSPVLNVEELRLSAARTRDSIEGAWIH